MINSIFLSPQELAAKEDLLKNIATQSEHLKKGLFVLEYQNKRYLMWSVIPHTYCITNDSEKSFWVFHPVGNKPIKKDSDFLYPLMLNLKNVEVEENGLTATIIETNEVINIATTNNEINKKSLEKHNFHMTEINLNLKQLYQAVIESEISKRITEFTYNQAWE